MPVEHPACAEGVHLPIGISGDDAKYTLAGNKLIIMMISFLLQEVIFLLQSFTNYRGDDMIIYWNYQLQPFPLILFVLIMIRLFIVLFL